MKVTTEKLENNLAKIIIEVENADFLKECDNVFQKNKSKYNVPGFRKGHVDKKTIEKMYGEGVFFEDACDNCIHASYPKAVDECGLDVISKPEIAVTKIGKDENLVYEATVAITPEFKVANYKGVEAKIDKVEVKNEEIEEMLKKEQEKNCVIETKDGEIVNGDVAVIDFEGFCEGVAFPGGKGTDYSLEIGSHTFVDTFEDQLIGHKKGDSLEVNVHFPKEYHKDLADKDAMFKVTIKEVKQKILPPIDDEFANSVSEFNTLKELKEDYKKKIQKDKEADARVKAENEVVDKIVDATELTLDQRAIDTEVDYMVESVGRQLQNQGITLEKYLEIIKKSMEEFRKGTEKDAIKNLKARLILDKIAKDENVQASDEMVMEEFERMANQYGMKFENIKDKISDVEKENVRKDLKYKAVIKFIMDNAKVK